MDLDLLGGLLARLTTAVERLADTTDELLAEAKKSTAASEAVTASILRNEAYTPPPDPLKGRW